MEQKEKEKLFMQIATWQVAGMSDAEVAKLLSVDEARIGQLIALPEYMEIKMRLATEQAEKDSKYNDLWDLSEEKALRIVKTTLDAAPRDGEFALRVAAVANRARRRNSNTPGITAQQGMRASVSLPLSFVRKLEAKNGEVTITEAHFSPDEKPQQNINILKPTEVERMFAPSSKTIEHRKATKADMLDGLELKF